MKSAGLFRHLLPFIVLTVGLESHLESKQTTIYCAIKASHLLYNSALRDNTNSLQAPQNFKV